MGELTWHPIIFSDDMVRPLDTGHKTMTRRVIVPNKRKATGVGLFGGVAYNVFEDRDVSQIDSIYDPRGSGCRCHPIPCPFGKIGDRLWVKQTHRFVQDYLGCTWIVCRADGRKMPVPEAMYEWTNLRMRRWHPPRFMSRWASRLSLEVTSVRAERLQDITPEDARAEGVELVTSVCLTARGLDRYVFEFRAVWDSLHAKTGNGWVTNPVVWVIGLKVLADVANLQNGVR